MTDRFLVTGSSGTVGTRLCEILIGSKKQVIGLDKVPNKWMSKINKLTISKDLRYKFKPEHLPKKIDLVIHLAANARVYDLIVNPSLARDNVTMLFNILEFCRKKDIEKFIFSSSREVYGNTRS
ncbi:MAG: NAD(P)-dependent oxidoreductase, partial [Candidatus Bathyarchaeia archaeon]